MPGAVNVTLRWARPGGGPSSIAAGIGNAAAQGLPASVASGGNTAPTITSPTFLVAGTVNTVYPTTTFTATGTAPITWSIPPGGGTLPAGMSFSSAGVLSGTPTATASGSVTFTATNAFGSANRPLTLTVNAAGGGGGGTLTGIEVQVAPVVGGVQGSFETLSGFTQLSSWVDGAYTQDFWRAGNTIDDLKFVVTRERGTDRVEVWIYRPPYKVFRPLTPSSSPPNNSFDYSWWPGSTVANAAIGDDRDYDLRISVNSSLITPQESASSTTRVKLATGSIRRLVSSFKPWDWTKIQTAVNSYRLPSYDLTCMSDILYEYSAGYGIPSTEATIAPYSSRSFSHNTLGGTNSSNWYDGNFSSGPGGSQLGRGLNQSLEAAAISDTINGVTANHTQLELYLRRSAEYFGSYPQRTFLDESTFKPIDPQLGNSCWGQAGGVGNLTYVPFNTYYVPGRTGYSNWATTHLYNNGSVQFEATRDPFYALLLQTNVMAALQEATGAYAADELRRVLNINTLPRDSNGGLIWPLPQYVISPNSERGRWWSLAAIQKAKIAATVSPLVDFLWNTSEIDAVMQSGISLHNAFMQQRQNAILPTQITNQTEADAASNVLARSIDYWGVLFWDGNPGITPGSPPSGHPKMLSASTFISSGYSFQSLIYLVSSGEAGFQLALERAAKFCINRLIHWGGMRSWKGYGNRGSEVPIVPTGANASNDQWTSLPLAFSSPAEWASYWVSNYYAVANQTNVTLNDNSLTQMDYFIHIYQNLRSLKVLNDKNALNVIKSDVNSAMAVFNQQLSPASGYVKGIQDKAWAHTIFMWKP